MSDPGPTTGRPPGKRPGLVVHDGHPLNAETPPRLLREGFATPADAFYVRCHGDVPEVDPGTWRFWEATLNLSPGGRGIVARATDSDGGAQPASVGSVWNFLGYANNAWHGVGIEVE